MKDRKASTLGLESSKENVSGEPEGKASDEVISSKEGLKTTRHEHGQEDRIARSRELSTAGAKMSHQMEDDSREIKSSKESSLSRTSKLPRHSKERRSSKESKDSFEDETTKDVTVSALAFRVHFSTLTETKSHPKNDVATPEIENSKEEDVESLEHQPRTRESLEEASGPLTDDSKEEMKGPND